MTKERWAEIASITNTIYPLEHKGRVWLYELKDKASYNDPFGRLPLYVIFVGDKQVYTNNHGVREAYQAYERYMKMEGGDGV